MIGLKLRLLRTAHLALALSSLTICNPVMAQGSPAFFDNFDTLNTSRWYVSDGWTNGDFQNCGWSAKEVYVRNGILNVGFSKNPGAQNRNYRCGELQSNQTFSYGTFEARLKTPAAGSGLDSAFFTYIGPAQKKPHDEIDLEFLLKDETRVHTTTFVSDKSGNGEETPLPAAASSAFVDYAMVWSPDKVQFFANHKLIRTIDGPHQSPVQPQKLFFSLWGSDTLSDWMGPFQDPGTPITMQVDWAAYTPAGQRCLFPESITCSI
jgi:endo-1,3-1,4-beta-glycanase ExoK